MVEEDKNKLDNSNDEAKLLEKVITQIEQKYPGRKVICRITLMVGKHLLEKPSGGILQLYR